MGKKKKHINLCTKRAPLRNDCLCPANTEWAYSSLERMLYIRPRHQTKKKETLLRWTLPTTSVLYLFCPSDMRLGRIWRTPLQYNWEHQERGWPMVTSAFFSSRFNQQGASYCFYSWMEDESKTSKTEYNMIFMSIKMMAEKGGTQSASLLWGLSFIHSALLWKLY